MEYYKALRKNRMKLTQVQMADLIGVTQAAISQTENSHSSSQFIAIRMAYLYTALKKGIITPEEYIRESAKLG